MKKVLAAIAFGALLFSGFMFAEKPVESASELEPPIFPTLKSFSSVDLM